MNEQFSREEFIALLKVELKNIDPIEFEEVINYYNEYFDEALVLGEDNLRKVLDELGSPKKIAAEIKQNTAVKDLLDDEKKGGDLKNLWLIILGIFSLPITFPLGMAFVAIVFSIIVAIASLLFAFFVTGGALIISGFSALVGIFALIFTDPLASLMMFGVMLATTSLGLIVVILSIIISQNSLKCIGIVVNKFINNKRKG